MTVYKFMTGCHRMGWSVITSVSSIQIWLRLLNCSAVRLDATDALSKKSHAQLVHI
jgi:hypothetical protein